MFKFRAALANDSCFIRSLESSTSDIRLFFAPARYITRKGIRKGQVLQTSVIMPDVPRWHEKFSIPIPERNMPGKRGTRPKKDWVTATSSSCGDTGKPPPPLRTGCKCARVTSSPAVGWGGLGGVGRGAGLFLAGVRVLIARIGAGEKRSKREWRSSQKRLSNWLRSRDTSRGFAKACSTSCRMMSPRDNDGVRITD